MKLLYAEDEPTMAEAVTDILNYHNFMVDAVTDGAEALAYARAGDYDGIIMDIMLPKMSGLDVLRELREGGCRTPVLENIIYLGLPLIQRAVFEGSWAQIKKQKIWRHDR